MQDDDILKGKRILIVDDEPDILETLEDLLDMCLIDSAPDFDSAKKFIEKNTYDAAILDIMGVHGHELLRLATHRHIPALMLTAHALSPDSLIQSIKAGAQSYIPKDMISDIPLYVRDIIQARQEGVTKHGRWFERLKPFFDKKFGHGWRKKDEAFWDEFDKTYSTRVSRDELDEIM